MSKPAERFPLLTTVAPMPRPSRRRPSLWSYPGLNLYPDARLHENARIIARTLMLRLRFYRVEQSLTREELAELTTMPASAIKRAERFGELSLQRFLQIALQLGLDGDLLSLFQFRRYRVPPLVLYARTKKAKHGSRARRHQTKHHYAGPPPRRRGRA